MGTVASAGTALADWRQHFDVNFFSLVTALRAALPALRKSERGGRVVFVSSGSAVGGLAGWAPYNAAKVRGARRMPVIPND
jgi:NAD(P)-dependent dehydrogenase (short-subunit alcohol dehydrogenase family)